jgi:probable addiction module antidote protein
MSEHHVVFDAADYLDDDATIVAYLNAAIEEPHPDVFLQAVADVARARGMRTVANQTGLGRESLYKALAPGAKPRYDTVFTLLRTLGIGVRFVSQQPASKQRGAAKVVSGNRAVVRERAASPYVVTQGLKDMSLDDIVIEYRTKWRPAALAEMQWFAKRPSFEDAITAAGRAEGSDGKRFAHQRRIPAGVLRIAEQRLNANASALAASASFDELHAAVRDAIGSISGIGDLMIYDTSLRLGAWQRLTPRRVYLHAGTLKGARAIGVPPSQRTIPMNALPRALSRLTAWEAEDILCLYADRLAAQSERVSLHVLRD